MKKVFSIFFSLIFLASAMGLTVNSHYCGMKLRSVSMVEQGCCCKKNSGMKKDCCKNEIKYVKITDNYSPSTQLHLTKIDIAPIVISSLYIPSVSEYSVSILFNNHSPPPKFRDRVIVFRSLLI